MTHEARVRYSALTLAKLRSELVLADGFVFNNDYEGDPTSGSVKIPVRDDEVTVSDYDKANGIKATNGGTSYTTLLIDKDKAINEVIDGFDSASVPDNLIAERLDSGGYALARQLDIDGGTTLLSGATVMNVAQIDAATVYSTIVSIRTAMSKANVPNDGKRYLLVTPDTYAAILNCPQFLPASSLGDEVKKTGAVGTIAGFLVKEWNDATANLAMLAGHPKFATRVHEWAVPVKVQDLDQSGTYIGACAVQGRRVYGHKVLRSLAIRAVYAPGSLISSFAPGGTAGTTVATISAGNTGTTYAYKINPASRAEFGTSDTDYNGTSLTSGTTKIPVKEHDIIEIVNIGDGKIVSVGYHTIKSGEIKS